MKIAVCDDNEQDLMILSKHITKKLKQIEIDAQVILFDNGKKFIDYIESNDIPAICFLDIYMGEITGIDIAKYIRKKNESAAIVFVTMSDEHMSEGWDVGALHYLKKPFSEEKLEEALRRALRNVEFEEKYVEFTIQKIRKKVLLSHICYVESQNKHCYIHTKYDGVIKLMTQLPAIHQMLSDKRFLRCHQSYVINMDYVSELAGNDFIMDDGLAVPLRVRERKAVVSAYEDYCFERVRRL